MTHNKNQNLKPELSCTLQGLFHRRNGALVHPFSPDWYVGGGVWASGRYTSIVEITRFQLQQFTVSMKELAEWFGLELSRMIVDECLTP
jgi:hypothetical protein